MTNEAINLTAFCRAQSMKREKPDCESFLLHPQQKRRQNVIFYQCLFYRAMNVFISTAEAKTLCYKNVNNFWEENKTKLKEISQLNASRKNIWVKFIPLSHFSLLSFLLYSYE